MKKICAIVAMDAGRVIGKNGALPWHYPEDLKYFSNQTRGHAVLMGRTTWDSLEPKYKPLPNRLNIVCSRTPEAISAPDEVVRYGGPNSAIEDFRAGKLQTPTETLWVVGGAQIYRETMALWDELFLTYIFSKHEGDTFFPEFEQDFVLADSDDHSPEYSFRRYVRKE